MKSTSVIVKKITSILEGFTTEKQQEVLNYVEFLQSKLTLHPPSELSWYEFIESTYGSCANDPIRVDDEGILDELDDPLEGVFNELEKKRDLFT